MTILGELLFVRLCQDLAKIKIVQYEAWRYIFRGSALSEMARRGKLELKLLTIVA